MSAVHEKKTGSLLILLPILLGLLSACNQTTQLAPIEQLGQPPDIRLRHHVVSKGDTLISIAWRYGMDYHQLAALNNIHSPYTIYVGQKIRLGEPETNGDADTAVAHGTEIAAVPDDSQGVTEVGEVREVTTTSANSGKKVDAPHGLVNTTVASNAAAGSDASSAAVTQSTGGKWQWPANGRVLATFSASDPLRKGVDLDGKQGDPVLAARSGNVVYAGSGLAGYGQLVIVKHDEQYLSAYGHNSKLLVKEGDTVKAGQKIAEIGSSGTDSNKLHFEVRKEGKPVDPLQYLPKK